MLSVTAFATAGARVPFERTTIERRDLGPRDVLIAIAYAGICHSDIHTAREEWGATTFPLVPGHEIAGVVEAIGDEVTTYAVGDRVGVGCMVDSCGECRHCVAGNEQFCRKNIGTYGSTGRDGEPTAGGYSTHIVVTEGFVLRIPDALPLDVAAPLLCAGITTYSPLRHWKVGPGSRVAVAGLGGLGHMGVKIAAAMGAEVTVLTRTDSKADDAGAFGAFTDPFRMPGGIACAGGGVGVELLVPAPVLIQRPVFLAQQRVLDAGLVLPDLDVLQEADFVDL